MSTNADIVRKLIDVHNIVGDALTKVERAARAVGAPPPPSFTQLYEGIDTGREAIAGLSQPIKVLAEDKDAKQDRLRCEIADTGEPLGYGFVVETILNSLNSEQLEFLLGCTQDAADEVGDQATLSPSDIVETAQSHLKSIITDLDCIPRIGKTPPAQVAQDCPLWENTLNIQKAQRLIEYANQALELVC